MMVGKPLVEVHTADIHFGVMDPQVQYTILYEQMILPLMNVQFDAFFINGDLFDHKFLANNAVISYALKFIDDVVNLCAKNGATLVLLHGTLSHDAHQLQLFYCYKDYIDIRIVNTIGFEIIKGTRVLCIPEEYEHDADYYNKYLLYSGDYDMVVLHGAIRGAIYGHDTIDLSGKTPTFGLSSFRRCNGPIICGHVHVACCYENHIYYSGSPLRWRFGEEAEKGFLICTFNPYTYQYYIHLQPIKSFRYDTVDLSDMLSFSPQAIINKIESDKANGIDFIKVKFDQSNPITDVIKKYFSTNRTVKIDAPDYRFTETINQNQQNNAEFADYAYMLDPNMTPYDIFTKYVNQQKGECFITAEELEQILGSIE
ncbi:MAG: hypothetical protein VZR64_04105 [Eubacterium sp.]|nr:hypothetical protein [Eubacterium sp.]